MDLGGRATQDSKPRSSVVMFAAPTELYKLKVELTLTVLGDRGFHSTD
jgi:hypothetical protein